MRADGEFLGLDAGSTTIKAVVLDAAGAQLRTYLAPVSGDYARDIEQALAALSSNGGAAVSGRHGPRAGTPALQTPAPLLRVIVATGYAQDLVPGALRTLTEISCHARGVHYLEPEAELVIDIGGQDCKAIRIGPTGKPLSFQMNDKCAAGTGRFLEVMARALGVPVAELAGLAAAAAEPARISSMCTVFAESEVIGLLARGRPQADVARGLLEAVAERVSSMVARLGPAQGVVLSGGVALNGGVAAALERRLGQPLRVPQQPQLTGALGAALAARELASQGLAGTGAEDK